MVDNKQLIQQAKSGNRQAIAALYDAYQVHIFRYVAYRVGDAALAEDLTAEAFLLMVKNLHTYEDRGRPFLAWLYTVAGNVVKMHYRRRKQTEFEPLPEEMIDHKANPAEITQTRLTQERLMTAMPRLTEIQRQVILLKFIEGFSNREVAAFLDKTEGSIKSLQHRALAALRRILAEEVQHEPS